MFFILILSNFEKIWLYLQHYNVHLILEDAHCNQNPPILYNPKPMHIVSPCILT